MSVLEPYEGYYYFNRSELSSLQMPLPVRNAPGGGKVEVELEEEVVLIFRADGHESRVVLGVSPGAEMGLDELDRYAAPAGFGGLDVRIVNRHLYTRYQGLQRDVRSAVG